MLTGASLDRALRKAATRPLSKQYHRATALAYGNDPLGRGRPIHGMRFNVDRGARVLYLGETLQVCMAEVDPGFPAGHWYCFPVEVKLDAVLHLDDASTRRSLGITLADIRVGFRGPNKIGQNTDTQVLGEKCAALGIVDGILYPSVAHKKGLALAVIEQNLRAGHTHALVRVPVDPNGNPLPVLPLPPGSPKPPATPAGTIPIWDMLPP